MMITSKKLALKISIHGTPAHFVAIARAAMRAGVSDSQSILIARLALTASVYCESMDTRDIADVTDRIVHQGHLEHATRQWARGRARHHFELARAAVQS